MRELFFKCIGAILVLYTGAAMGWRKGNAAMRRVQVLADICAFLGAVRDDLHFRCGRTEEILAAAQQNTRLSALPLYFSDLASGCGLQTELDNALCRTEREIAGVTRREERVLLRGALEYGNVAGWLCVQKKGAIESLPTAAEIEQILKEESV